MEFELELELEFELVYHVTKPDCLFRRSIDELTGPADISSHVWADRTTRVKEKDFTSFPGYA